MDELDLDDVLEDDSTPTRAHLAEVIKTCSGDRLGGAAESAPLENYEIVASRSEMVCMAKALLKAWGRIAELEK